MEGEGRDARTRLIGPATRFLSALVRSPPTIAQTKSQWVVIGTDANLSPTVPYSSPNRNELFDFN